MEIFSSSLTYLPLNRKLIVEVGVQRKDYVIPIPIKSIEELGSQDQAHNYKFVAIQRSSFTTMDCIRIEFNPEVLNPCV